MEVEIKVMMETTLECTRSLEVKRGSGVDWLGTERIYKGGKDLQKPLRW